MEEHPCLKEVVKEEILVEVRNCEAARTGSKIQLLQHMVKECLH